MFRFVSSSDVKLLTFQWNFAVHIRKKRLKTAFVRRSEQKHLTHTFRFSCLFQVSRDEWFSLWEEYAKNPSNPSEWQQAYMSVTFQLFDASGKFIMLSVPRIMKKNWDTLFPISSEISLNIYERISQPRHTETFKIINDDQYKNIRSLFTKSCDIEFQKYLRFLHTSILVYTYSDFILYIYLQMIEQKTMII